VADRVDYDEFGLFHENAAEYGLPYDGPPAVRRVFAEVAPGRRLSALAWQDRDAELVLLHGGAQNAHTWDTVALALGRPLVAIDLPGHGHSDGPGDRPEGQLNAVGNAVDVAAAVRQLAPRARAVVGMSLGGLTTIALTAAAPELVRKVVLVDILPGTKPGRSRHITDFVNGPPSFASLDELLERTARFNPGRSRSSLRRGILHNAEQQPDGTWVWRWARHRTPPAAPAESGARRDPAGRRSRPLRPAVGRGVGDHGAGAAGPRDAAGLGPRRRAGGGAPPPPARRSDRARRRRRPQPAGRYAARAGRADPELCLRPLSGGGVRPAAYSTPRMISTGQGEWWARVRPTEPSSVPAIPPWPRLPTTTIVAPLAASSRNCAADPSPTSTLTRTAGRSAVAAPGPAETAGPAAPA
jgi:pimeloyl-ACP methyl ester carboxylesterase